MNTPDHTQPESCSDTEALHVEAWRYSDEERRMIEEQRRIFGELMQY